MNISSFILFCVFLSGVFSLKAVYIGNEADKMYQDFLKPFGDIHEEINISYVLPTASDGYDDELNKAVEEQGDIVVMRCDDKLYSSNSKVLTENRVLVICINTYSVGRCSKSIISGVSIIPLIENVLTPIGFSFSGQFSILADAGEELNSFYVDRLKATASLFGGKIIYSYNGTLTDDVIQDYLMKTIDIKNFAVATLVVINNKQTLIDFMDKRKIQLDTLSMIDANEVPHMYPLFFLPGSLDYSVLQDPLIKPHLVGCYFVTGFTGLETYNITAEYKANYTNVNFNDPSGYEYAVIGGVLDGFIDINKKYPTNRVQSLLPLIYNKPLPYPGGELYILPSNYITLPLTYIRILTAGGYYSTTFIVPHDLDFEINSYYGSINTETCNFKINPVSGISTIDSLPIAFILDMSTYKNKLIRLYIDKMVADTSYVIGRKVTQLILDVSKPTSEIVDEILEYYTSIGLYTVYIIASYEKMIEFINPLYDYDIQIFYIGPTPGENCFKNVIFGDFLTSSYASLTAEYIMANNYDRVFIIGTTLYYGKTSRMVLTEKLIERGYPYVNIGFYDIVAATEDEANNITQQINDMPTIGDNNRTAIVLVVEREFIEVLIPNFYDHGMNYSNNFTIISYLFDEVTVDEYRKKAELVSFMDVIFIAYNNNDMESKVLDEFRGYVDKIASRVVPLFQQIALIHNLFSLMVQSIESSSSLLPSVYKDYLFHQVVKDPAYDQYEIYYNSYAQGKLRMFQVKSYYPKVISSTVLLEQKSSNRLYSFFNKTMTCAYKDGEMPITVFKTYKVVMVYDRYSSSDNVLMESFAYILDMINQDGGIGGREILPEYIHYSNIEELQDAIIEVGQNSDDILCYCGTQSREERDALADILMDQKKLLFSLSVTGGEVTYENILMINTIPNQRLEWIIMNQMAKNQTIIFVYLSNNEDSINTFKYVEAMVEFEKGNMYGIEVDPYNDDWDNVTERIHNVTNGDYDRYFMYTATSNYTETIVKSFNDNYPSNTLNGYVVDYVQSMFSNKSNAEGLYYSSCYSRDLTNQENEKLKKYVNTYKGNSAELINNMHIAFYISLIMMRDAINDGVNKNNDFNLRNYFYAHHVSSPLGTTTLFKNNYMSFPIYTSKIIDGVDTFYSAIENPIMPEPFLYLLHNYEYVDSDYSIQPPKVMEKMDTIGIAFVMDISNTEDEHYFYTYISIIQLRSQINDVSSIKNRYIRTELHDCPASQEKASDLVVRLQQRGIDLLVGGCNPQTRKYIAPSLESSDILFFYTVTSVGDSCDPTTFFATVTPNQEMYPFGLYLSTLSRTQVSILYYDDGSYDSRVKILESMYDAFEISIAHTCKVSQTNAEKDMEHCIVNSYFMMRKGGKIVAFFTSKVSDLLFDFFNKKICSKYNTREECIKKYQIFLLDQSHSHFDNTEGAGHFVISPFSNSIDDENKAFVKLFQKTIGRSTIYPNFYDANIYTTTMHLANVLKDSDSFDVADIRKQLYETKTSFVLGNVGFDVNNRMNIALFVGIINGENGNVDYYDTITENYEPDPYYLEFNSDKMYLCNFKNDDAKDKYLVPTVMFGVILPYKDQYFQSSIRFLTGLEIAAHDINQNGGVNGKNILLYTFTDGDNDEVVKQRVREVYEKHDITYYFGGWQQNIRIAANEALKEINGTLLVPNDYEGSECLTNEFYYGLPANSYGILLYWIRDHTKDKNILINSRTVFSETLANRIKDDLSKFQESFDYEIDAPLGSSNLTNVVSLIQRRSANGALIFSVLEGPAAQALIEAMDELNMRPPEYVVLGAYISQKQVVDLGDKFIGHYYIDTEITNDERAIELTKKLNKDYYDRYSLFDEVSRPVLRGYGAFDHLCQLLNIKRSFDRDAYKSLVYNTTVNTVMGDVVFRSNNHVDGSFKILTKSNKDEDYVADYEYYYPIINNGFLSLFYRENLQRCDIQHGIFDKYEYVTVGLIFDVNGARKDYHKKALYSALSALHMQMEEGEVLGKLILPISIDYNPDLELFEEELESKITVNNIKMTIGCTDIECKEISQKVCKIHHILFFFTDRFYGQECDYDTFYLGPLPNQYIPQILEYFIADSVAANLASITEDSYDCTSISTIIESQGGGMYYYKGSYVIDKTIGVDSVELQSLIGSMDGGGVILFTITDTNLLKKFLITVSELGYDKTKYVFVDTRSPIGKYDGFRGEYIESVYIVSEYFAEVESESNVEFKKMVNNYAYITKPTALANTANFGIKIWIEAVKAANTFDTDAVREKLLEVRTNDALGEFIFDPSHYSASPFYIGKFDKNGNFVLTYSKPKYVDPRPWSWDIPETYRMMCSFAPSVNNSKYEIPAERVLLASSLSGSLSELNEGEIDIFKMAIEEINDNGGVNGVVLETAVYDMLSDIGNCGDELIKAINTYDPKVIFFSGSLGCINIISDYIKSTDLLLFNVFKYPIGSCEQHLFTSNDHISLYDEVLNVLRNRNYDEFLIAFPRSVDYESAEYINEYLTNFNERTILAKSYDEVANQTRIYKESLKEGEVVCVIFSGYLEDYDFLIDKMKEAGLNEEKIHLIVADPSSAILLSKYNNYEVIQSYYLEDKREINQEFVNNAYQRLNRNDVYLNDILSGLYSSIKLWAKAVDTTKTFDKNTIRNELINQEGIDLPEGLVGYGTNQYLGRIMKISHKDANNKWNLVYDGKTAHYPKPFKITNEGDYYLCDFNDLTIGSGKSISTYTIGIVLSLTGDKAPLEKPIFDSILAGITYLNSYEQLLNYLIYYKLYDVKSDPSNYKSIFEQIDKNGIDFIFGGYDPDDYLVIANEMKDKNKIFFFCGHTYSEICAKNVIVSELHPSQIAKITIRRMLEDTTSAITVYSPSNYTKYLNEMIQTRMSYTNILLMGSVEYDLEKTNIQLRTVSLAMPNGGYIIATLENKEYYIHFYKAMYELGLTYPKYTVYNTLFDENIFNDLEPKYLSGHIVIGSYFESIQSKSLSSVTIPISASIFSQGLHVHIGDKMRIRTQYESAYSLLLYWKNICQNSNSIDPNVVEFKYDYELEVPSGSIELSKNNIFKRSVYSGYINDNNQIYINWLPSKALEADVYNQIEGEDVGFVCDWKTEKTEKYNTNPVHLAFIHEIDIGGKSEQQNLLIQDMTIEQINSEGGVNGRNVVAKHYFLTQSKIYATVRTIDQETDAVALFGCMSSKCRDEVNRYLTSVENSDFLFYFIGMDDGNLCTPSIISMGMTINQKIEGTISYLESIGNTYIFILGNTDNSTSVIADYIKRYINDKSMDCIGEFFLTPYNENAYTQLYDTLNELVSVYKSFCILNLFRGKDGNEFINHYKTAGLQMSAFVLVILNYDESDFSEENLNELSGTYITTSFTDSLTSTEAEAFIQTVKSYFQDAISLNEMYEVSYSTLYLWKLGMDYAAEQEGLKESKQFPSVRYRQLSLKYVSFSSPSGNLVLKNTNHVTKPIYLFRIMSGRLSKVYPSQGKEEILEPKLTYMDNSECEMGKTKVLYETNNGLRILVMVLMIILILISIASLVGVLSYRHLKIIKASSPLFLSYTLIALIMLSVSGFIFTLVPNDAICALRVWIVALSVDFLFGILLCKAWRIHKLFNNKEMKKVKISNMMLLQIIGGIELVQIIYLVIWWVIDPSVYTETYSVDYSNYLDDVYIRECTENDIFAFIEIGVVIVIFLFGARLAWKTRKASAEFNESKTLASIIGIMIVVGILEIPLNLMMAKQPDTLMMLRGIGVELCVIAVLVLQFAAKLKMFFYYFTTTTMGSSSSGSNSADSRHSRSLARKGVTKGRFKLRPNVFEVGNIGLCTISASDAFYITSGSVYGASYRSRMSVNSEKMHSNRNSVAAVVQLAGGGSRVQIGSVKQNVVPSSPPIRNSTTEQIEGSIKVMKSPSTVEPMISGSSAEPKNASVKSNLNSLSQNN